MINYQPYTMPTKPEDVESELIRQMFDEIMKMIREKHVKLESIVQRMVEQGTISQESFDRVYKLLTEYGKKKQWTS
jgi:proline dehydrogenase